MRALLALLVLLCLAPLAFAQAPLLSINVDSGGRPVLRNGYNAAATAWFVQLNLGPEETLIAFSDVTPFPAVSGRLARPARGPAGAPAGVAARKPIPPGATAPWEFSYPRVKSYKVLATMYADGARAGDWHLINRLLGIRQILYRDAAEGVALLDRFRSQPGGDPATLLEAFQQREAVHSAELREKLFEEPRIWGDIASDISCASIVANLRIGERRGDPVHHTVDVMLISLIQTYEALASSKPALLPVPRPHFTRTAEPAPQRALTAHRRARAFAAKPR